MREAHTLEIRDYFRILRKGWVLIVVCVCVGVAVASIVSITAVPKYQAFSKVFVSIQSAGTVADLSQGSSFAQNQVKSYADIVATPVVLQPVIDSLGLQTTASELATRVSASIASGTVVVEIDVSDGSPTRAADIANSLSTSFENVVSKIVPVDAQGVSPVKITVLQQAMVPSEPYSPSTKVNIPLGAVIGLVLGLILAVVTQTLDTRIRSEHDIEQITDAPILGAVAFDPKASTRPLVVHDHPRSPRAESFRTLRTNLQFIGSGNARRSFVVTSSIPGEGKSTSAVNLAIVAASAGTRVVLIDADLRKPKVADYLGLEGGAGLTDVLVGRANVDDVLQRWGVHDLFVLPAGRIPPNPSELLGSNSMIALIGELENRYDLVIFDAPPLLPVTDAAILSIHTGGALVMVAAGRAHRGQLKGSILALKNVGSKVAGIVLTMMPVKGPDAYGSGKYGYGYGYAYGYGYGYDGEEKNGESRKSRRLRQNENRQEEQREIERKGSTSRM
ncbi:polysaccharide biosynthesis tyrosine autokinase [Subtercola sp. RTI3]|uniref:polysaccharide biosynthesis tyrosine autokinase n=1 Tax=Subtercola sp. RTI3 TaxID=3048639 RepID=UPI002B2297D8|nr:polysaccharide biosynthesis tyrosine autokinase [Subtercola sp. RTI3]MEA9986515.1 polysaccharide biosynthesis tyrosine autokinase [Subtercola sp. RTI3]